MADADLGRVAVVGLGNMGSAIAEAALDSGAVTAEDLVGIEPATERREQVGARLGIEVTDDAPAGVQDADVVLLAVKPDVVPTVLADVGAVLSADVVVVSIAAGVTTATIEDAVGRDVAVVRIMPNTPLLVGQGMCVLTPGSHAGDDALDAARALVSGAGDVRTIDESLFDAVTAVSGSGPGFVFAVAEAMINGARDQGLSDEDAVALVEQTVAGAGALLRARDETAGQLREMVSSPGGTTLAGLEQLAAHDLDGAMRAAIRAATERGRELGSA